MTHNPFMVVYRVGLLLIYSKDRQSLLKIYGLSGIGIKAPKAWG